ncbi:ABC transporter substrate-binding protein [Salinibacterium sp. ZJ454]|uniref:ABC transporter substrate-binding protein n=1 Tax=Salinibacterium sp. ZJ454 TaxID=2708339 RepID=UPI001420B414|nr:ABC transporter substrate-binding protein [Salinibacterium sp. ZJ454]
MVLADMGRRRSRWTLTLTSVAAGTLLLAGCAGGATAQPGSDTTGDAPEAAQLGEILGVEGGEAAGEGVEWTLGAALPLSGPGAPEGKEMRQAIELAIEQIEASGGPSISLSAKDIKNPDPVAAKQAATELAEEGVAGKISTYGDALGAMIEDTIASKMLTLDGVGGAQPHLIGTPYYYGTTAVAPADVLPGAMEWLKESESGAKTVGLVGWELGPLNDPIRADFSAKVEDAGLEFNGLWETVSPMTQDFASLITKIKANQPDVIFIGMGAQAPGAFTSQAVAAGIDSTLIGIEFTKTALDASKGSFDAGAYHFAMNYFDATNPTNPLAEYFVETYSAKYPDSPEPSFYAANAYENTLAFWQFLRGTIEAGGDVTSGDDLVAALEANPDLPSLYGGDDSTVGVTTINLETHGVASRAMGVYQWKDGSAHALATFDIDAADFELK